MSETDLAKHVIEWLEAQHWDVYQEVRFWSDSGIADIVAVRDNKLWIIECKAALTFAVLEQASKWTAHFRSIAVPSTHQSGGRDLAYRVARDYLRVGVIEVGHMGSHFYGDVFERRNPPIMREFHRDSKAMIGRLKEEHKHFAAAGGNHGGYFTPYKSTIEKVKYFIMQNPGCSMKEIMAHLNHDHHYSTDATAKTSLRTALSNWERDWCVVETEGREMRYYHKQHRIALPAQQPALFAEAE